MWSEDTGLSSLNGICLISLVKDSKPTTQQYHCCSVYVIYTDSLSTMERSVEMMAMFKGKDHDTLQMETEVEMAERKTDMKEEVKEGGHHQRGQWSSRMDYILSMVGYCVGFGNLWRFPYICSRNGGGAFLIPFVIFLMVTAFPMFYMEACLAQFSGKGTVHVWSFCPLLKGVGIGAIIEVIICLPYYNILLAWPIYYMVKSCSSVLPWTTCGNWWNTELCVEDLYGARQQTVSNGTFNITRPKLGNTAIADLWKNKTLAHSAVEEFYQYNVLGITSGLHEIGSVQWHILGCLFASYVIIFLCLFRGVKATGKVVYVTALLPYVLLLAIFIRIITLPGAVDGLLYYIKPDFEKLLELQVWLEACLQVFYSLGPGWGIIMTSSSYNKFHEPLLRDSVILCAVSEGTSIFAGFVTFSILGVMADKIGVGISEVVSSGPGLGFVAYTEALAQLPLPQLWAFLFFLMLLTIGLDSQFLFAEIISTAIIDHYPKKLRKRRTLVTAALCGGAFLLGVVICTQGGPYIFQLLDWYLVAVSLFLICLLECIASVWLYGIQQFSNDVDMMLGRPLPILVKILWGFVTPAILIIVICMTLLRYQPPTYGSYVYPPYASIIGWTIAMFPVAPIPILMINVIRKQNARSFKKKLMLSILPESNWRPVVPALAVKYRDELLRNRKTFRENIRFIFKK